jgi:hypothetical protein
MSLESLASLGWPSWPILTCAGLLCLMLFLVIRQNRKDFVDLIGTRDEIRADCPSTPSSRRKL